MDNEISLDHIEETEQPGRYELGEFISYLLSEAAYCIIDHEDADEESLEQAQDQAWDFKLTKHQISHLVIEALEELGRLDCLWCGTDTATTGEYYMVNDDLWELYGPPKHTGILCIGCLEDRIGRCLCPDDFTDAPCNDPEKESMSERLRNRITGN